MKFVTAEEMFKLLHQAMPGDDERQHPGESFDAWLQRTVAASMEGVEDGSNPVITSEEYERLKRMYRDSADSNSAAQPEVSARLKQAD